MGTQSLIYPLFFLSESNKSMISR